VASTVTQMDAPNPQLVWDMLNAYQRTVALCAAIDLDLFTAISEGANTASDLAKRCDPATRGIRILCDYLAAISLLTKTGNPYSLAPTSAVRAVSAIATAFDCQRKMSVGSGTFITGRIHCRDHS
jgi:Dimerisation domain